MQMYPYPAGASLYSNARVDVIHKLPFIWSKQVHIFMELHYQSFPVNAKDVHVRR